MPVELATYVNDLTPANPLGSDPVGQGDDHLRLIKSVLLATLPNMGAVFGQVRQLDVATSLSSTWNTNLIVSTTSLTATVVLTLPAPSSITTGFTLNFFTTGGAAISLLPSGGGSINGAASFAIPERNVARAVFQGGTVWRAMTSPTGESGSVFGGDVTIPGTLTVSGTVVLTRGQIKFPASQNLSSDANVLDDYEEGTFTLTVTFGTPGTFSVTYTARSGVYVKVGALVTVTIYLVCASFVPGTASGNFLIGTLPFATEAGPGIHAGPMAYQGATLDAGYSQLSLVSAVAGSASLLTIESGSNVAISTALTVTHWNGARAPVIYASFSYILR